MPNRSAVPAAIFLAVTIASAPFQAAGASTPVKTKALCARYGGNLMENFDQHTKKAFPWLCDTPVQDRACIKQLGPRGWFDANAGRCKKMTQEEYECQLYDLDECYW